MDNKAELESYAAKYYYDQSHSLQVLRLSEILFESLTELHGLAKAYLQYLQEAAVLHDIGLCKGTSKHHKTTCEILLTDPPDCIDQVRLVVVACIARYHRKALPSPSHGLYSQLSTHDRRVVQKLAALLRIADGLDYTHDCCVRSLECSIKKNEVDICLISSDDCRYCIAQATKKSDLFTQVFDRNVVIYTR